MFQLSAFRIEKGSRNERRARDSLTDRDPTLEIRNRLLEALELRPLVRSIQENVLALSDSSKELSKTKARR